ncbi:MAG: N-acetylglucosamine kinase [Pirellulales bacterium]|nr:N-acetylglucosamine kinase [Pirellulales bacterium]
MPAEVLILGIDGGGSKTVALLAAVAPTGPPAAIGRGASGAVNIQSVGTATALENLDHAVATAFRDARIEPGKIAAAVLCLAGSAREENQRVFRSWADNRALAERFEITSDALPVLAAASPEGWGVALISGTGSFAFGRNAAGSSARSGGWGFLFGDEGSGYWIALAALRAVAQAADGRGPQTRLVETVLERLGIRTPQELVSAVYPNAADRAWIASMAELVVEADREQDEIARTILDDAASQLAAMVAAVAYRLDFADRAFPLGLAGGVILRGGMTDRLKAQLRRRDLCPSALHPVPEPVTGAVKLAYDLVRAE